MAIRRLGLSNPIGSLGVSTLPSSAMEVLTSLSPRHYIGFFRREFLLTSLQTKLSNVKAHNFQVVDLQPHAKDGGVYVRFAYTPQVEQEDTILKDVENAVREEASAHGGFPNWLGLASGNVWVVQGSPWREVRPTSPFYLPDSLSACAGYEEVCIAHGQGLFRRT
jgi:hypothetical protein